jgi:sulfopyruvate decarboxylase TPP-binding subunit
MKHVTSDSGLLDVLLEQGHDFFTGVPDSALKHFIGELHRLPAEQHVPATWEAETVGIAAGGTWPAEDSPRPELFP